MTTVKWKMTNGNCGFSSAPVGTNRKSYIAYTTLAPFMRDGNGSRQLVSRRFVSISRLAETDRRVCLNIRKHARHNRLEDFINQPVEAELASHRQVLVILQAAAEIGELNG